MLKLQNKYKIAVKYCNTSINGYGVNFGLKTLTDNYLKHFDDWYQHQDEEYDVVFCIGSNPEGIKAKRIVYLCASQNQKSYDNVEKCNFVQYADGYTDVILVRENECIQSLKEDFPNCRIHCKNFILFDFDEKYAKIEGRKNAILHLGRICKFKNSLELLVHPEKYICEMPICSYGGNLFEIKRGKIKYFPKLEKYYNEEYHVIHKTLDEDPIPGKINFYPNYKPEQLYDIATKYNFAICFYDEKFNDNVEYAMLEMINAGCLLIVNQQYVCSFTRTTVLKDLGGHYPLLQDQTLKQNEMTLRSFFTKSLLFSREKYVKYWSEIYDNDLILESLFKCIELEK